jgi:hypothetical protein
MEESDPGRTTGGEAGPGSHIQCRPDKAVPARGLGGAHKLCKFLPICRILGRQGPGPQAYNHRDLCGGSVMSDERCYFEQAADSLKESFRAHSAAKQDRLVEKAQRLRRLAIAQERARSAGLFSIPSASDPQDEDRAP